MGKPAVLPVTVIPGWPNPPAGLFENMTAADGGPAAISPHGVHVTDDSLATTYFDSFVGSSTELSHNQKVKQAQLDTLFDDEFDLGKFIRGGTVTTVTAANVGSFIATINNNYRSLRAQIAAATSLSQLNAINLHAGWPPNP